TPAGRCLVPRMLPWFLATAVAAAHLAAPPVAHPQAPPADEWLTRPVSDATFRTYLEFFAYNAALPFAAQVLDTTVDQGVVREHLTYVSTPGQTVTAFLYRPSASASPGRGGVILLHGGSPRGKNSVAPLSELMARDGWTVLAVDLLHYGERVTGLFEKFTNEEKSERLYNEPATYVEFVTQTVKDVRRGYDYLVQSRGVAANRVVLVGMSRGAVLATIAGAAENRLASVVLLHGGHVIVQEHGHQPAACPANYVSRIGPRPLFMLNSTNDAVFLPATSIRPFQRLAQEPVQIRWADGPHGFLSPEDRATLLEWLRSVP
ncbi:MAG TPA: alpha/beta fold hydrolase, partial [Gemmatimonadales bacterium]|nr:alpha/beta fold hydrolase [Gemmatimonadales bacterium]